MFQQTSQPNAPCQRSACRVLACWLDRAARLALSAAVVVVAVYSAEPLLRGRSAPRGESSSSTASAGANLVAWPAATPEGALAGDWIIAGLPCRITRVTVDGPADRRWDRPPGGARQTAPLGNGLKELVQSISRDWPSQRRGAFTVREGRLGPLVVKLFFTTSKEGERLAEARFRLSGEENAFWQATPQDARALGAIPMSPLATAGLTSRLAARVQGAELRGELLACRDLPALAAAWRQAAWKTRPADDGGLWQRLSRGEERFLVLAAPGEGLSGYCLIFKDR